MCVAVKDVGSMVSTQPPEIRNWKLGLWLSLTINMIFILLLSSFPCPGGSSPLAALPCPLPPPIKINTFAQTELNGNSVQSGGLNRERLYRAGFSPPDPEF